MFDYRQYKRNYFMPPEDCLDWAKKEYVDQAPIWCSVDLRDGNQALIEPMNLNEKLEFFNLLVKLGFKEIEVGFPAASETEYQLLRTLIDKNMIPQDVTIQVLTQAREHIIRKTFEAVKGAPNVIVHVYNSTSLAQREQVFHKDKEEIKQIAIEGAKLLKELAKEAEGNISFEYSPESFTGTEVDYAVDVCNEVIDIWEPTPEHKVYINIPATVEMSMPHVFASQIEYVSRHLHNRDSVILSLHPHNDRGCGVSDAEMGLLAGADRIEGTLFGNGERTGISSTAAATRMRDAECVSTWTPTAGGSPPSITPTPTPTILEATNICRDRRGAESTRRGSSALLPAIPSWSPPSYTADIRAKRCGTSFLWRRRAMLWS